jgi:hypothetical protein
MRKCPKCGLISPSESQCCDCGNDLGGVADVLPRSAPRTGERRARAPRLVLALGACAIAYGVFGLASGIFASVSIVALGSRFPLGARTIAALLFCYGVSGVWLIAGIGILRLRRWARVALLWVASVSLALAALSVMAVGVGSALLWRQNARLDLETLAAVEHAVVISGLQVVVVILPLTTLVFGLTRGRVRESCSE